MTTMMSFYHRQLPQSPLNLLLPGGAANPRTKTRSSPLRGRAVGCVERRPKLSRNLLRQLRRLLRRREKCLKDYASVYEDEELPKTLLPCLPPRLVQIIRKHPHHHQHHQRSSKTPPNLQKPRRLPEITTKPGLHRTAHTLVQCLPLRWRRRLPPEGNNKRRRRTRTLKPAAERRKRGRRQTRMRGGCPSLRWSPTTRRKTTMAKTKAPCLPLPPAPDLLVSGSRPITKSCEVWLKIPRRLKCCGSSRGVWSRSSRIRSRGGGRGEGAAPEVHQRRPLQRRTLPLLGPPLPGLLSTNQTKTVRHRALKTNLKVLLPNLLRTKTVPTRVHLCTPSPSEGIPRTPRHTFPPTCRC